MDRKQENKLKSKLHDLEEFINNLGEEKVYYVYSIIYPDKEAGRLKMSIGHSCRPISWMKSKDIYEEEGVVVISEPVFAKNQLERAWMCISQLLLLLHDIAICAIPRKNGKKVVSRVREEVSRIYGKMAYIFSGILNELEEFLGEEDE